MKVTNPSGKTAWVTGTSRSMGRASTLALARAGAKVLVHQQQRDPYPERFVHQMSYFLDE